LTVLRALEGSVD